MTQAHPQIVGQFNALLQQSSTQVQQLLEQAAAGCRQMIAQNPTDPTPLSNALGAIEQQVKAARKRVNDAVTPTFEQITAAGPGDVPFSHVSRGRRQFDRWAEEAWMRFETTWRVENYRAMWPHVQQALQKPAPCSRCGGPLRRVTPHKSETIACPACHTANQVMPETVVAVYYQSMPHHFAFFGAMEKHFAIYRYKDEVESAREAEYAARGTRTDEPMESLKRREAMELDYWTTYATAKVGYEGGGPADVKSLVDSRMKFFYDDMNRNDVWRRAHGLPDMADVGRVPEHLKNVDDWGPLRPDQIEEETVHDCLLRWAIDDPPKYQAMLRQLGYRDETQRAVVHETFMRHHMAYLPTPDGVAMMSRAAMRAMNEQQKYAVQAGAAAGLLDPIEGVSMEVYGTLQARQAGAKADEFQQLLAQHQMDQAKWERVQKGWLDRMSKDNTGAVATEYSKAFMAAGAGKFAQAGAAGAAVYGGGGMGQQQPAAAEPVSFEKYAEISGAMVAWTKQGKDISAGLDKHFQMTAMDFSQIGMYWNAKMMNDFSMFDRLSELTSQYEQKYLAMP